MSDAAQLVDANLGGKTFRCTKRTAAHLAWTIQQLADQHPGAELHIIQPSYNDGVRASAGTHDKDAVFDVWIEGLLNWWSAQRFLRACGWAAWYRYPPAFSHHIHMVSLGYPGEVGHLVPGQVADYYEHRSGLKGHADDPSWHPADIDATVFDYHAWKEAQMHYLDWPAEAREAFLKDVRRAVLDATVPSETARGGKRKLSGILTSIERLASKAASR